MEIVTLQELKKLSAESGLSENTDQSPDSNEGEEIEVETVEPATDETGEDSEGEQDSESLEFWQQSEESEASQDGKTGFVPNAAAKKLRLKAKAYREERDEHRNEIELLRQELEALKSGNISKPAAQELKRPKLSDYGYDEDAHAEALDRYYDARADQRSALNSQASQQQAHVESQVKAIESAVTKHYDAASELIQKHNIKEDDFRNADGLIRSTIESIMPNRGDSIADGLIAKLVEAGEGSEKVWLYLGRNAAQLGKLKASLERDPSGLSAAIMLGELRIKATRPIQAKSNAPEPQKRIKGDGTPPSALRKQWEKSKDPSERIKLKRQAKKSGEDVSKW